MATKYRAGILLWVVVSQNHRLLKEFAVTSRHKYRLKTGKRLGITSVRAIASIHRRLSLGPFCYFHQGLVTRLYNFKARYPTRQRVTWLPDYEDT